MRLFQIRSDFSLPHGAKELEPAEVAVRIQGAFPDATIDWSKGRAKAQKRLDELIAAGCPEIIYRGQQRLVDNMFHAKIPVARYRSTLRGYCFGFSHYDGCISLEAYPDDIDALKCGSQEFADRLALEYILYSNIGNIELRCSPKSAPTPCHPTAHSLAPNTEAASGANEQFVLESIKAAIAAWRGNLLDNALPNRSLVIPSDSEIHRALVTAIKSIGPVIQLQHAADQQGPTKEFCVEYPEWIAVVSIPSTASYFDPVDG